MSTNRNQQQPDFLNQLKDILKPLNKIKQDVGQAQTEKKLLNQIGQWERESIGKIQAAAKKVRTDLQQFVKTSSSQINSSLNKLFNDIQMKQRANNCTEHDIQSFNNLLQICTDQWKQLNELNIDKNDLSSSSLIKIIKVPAQEKETASSRLPDPITFVNESNENVESEVASTLPSSKNNAAQQKNERPHNTSVVSRSQADPYPSVYFNVDSSSNKNIQQLFERLGFLPAMEKNGPMSGDCNAETSQMERFLSQTFGFRNIPDEYLVQGVKSFRLTKPPHSLNPDTVIQFPGDTRMSFAMTVREILDWQKSYAVYADHTVPGMTKEFLRTALQGLSKPGDEAFRMKFVVRISQCPILMEFNARIIPREVKHDWPHRIKLVSVTGIDFAGRIHDVNDIIAYVANWPDIYELNPKSGSPAVYNGRDFRIKAKDPRSRLNENTLLKDLMSMARLRLRACDKENVQIVVETGIGLGVFAGRAIGVDEKVRALSAKAIRTILEQDGSSYENILGVVFALPIFDGDVRNGRRQDVYQAFADEFNTNKYIGCIPVMIADQDMHRLTVAIAFEGYRVSELNPADSHGVFGEYWQNRGPAVEEKLALTTVGLLVQHHLFNPHILDPDHYKLV